jgi:hypothetical protein
MASFDTWDSYDTTVQSNLTEGQALSSQHTLLAFGPPFLGRGGADAGLEEGALSPETGGSPFGGGEVLWPAGLVSSFGLQQQQPVIPVPEIGSERRYTVVGSSDGGFSMQRTLFHGPSLLRATMAYFKAPNNPDIQVEPLIDNEAAQLRRNPHNWIHDNPGNENAHFNLGSDLFRQAFGLLVYFKDVNREDYGAIYLEQCHIGSHSLSTSAGQVVIAEGMQCSFARVRPVSLSNPIPTMSHLRDGGTSGKITIAGSQYTDPSRDGDNRTYDAPTATNI